MSELSLRCNASQAVSDAYNYFQILGSRLAAALELINNSNHFVLNIEFLLITDQREECRRGISKLNDEILAELEEKNNFKEIL